MLSADDMALFREMAAAYRKYGMRVSVTGAPLTVDRPGRFQGQVIGIDPKAFDTPSAAPDCFERTLGADFNITSSTGATQQAGTFSVPDGDWLIGYTVSGQMIASIVGSYITARLGLASGSGTVSIGTPIFVCNYEGGGGTGVGTASGFVRLTGASGATLALNVIRVFGGGTVTTSRIYGGTGTGTSFTGLYGVRMTAI